MTTLALDPVMSSRVRYALQSLLGIFDEVIYLPRYRRAHGLNPAIADVIGPLRKLDESLPSLQPSDRVTERITLTLVAIPRWSRKHPLILPLDEARVLVIRLLEHSRALDLLVSEIRAGAPHAVHKTAARKIGLVTGRIYTAFMRPLQEQHPELAELLVPDEPKLG
jgi:hypothetical protein